MTMMTIFDDFDKLFDAFDHLGRPKPLNHPAHRYAYDDVDKDDNDKYDLDGHVFNPKGKTNGFLIVFYTPRLVNF